MLLRLFCVGLDRSFARRKAAKWVRTHLQPTLRPSELALRNRCEENIQHYVSPAVWEEVCREAGFAIINHQVCGRLV